ncbi:hypothetical protein STRDD13_00333 [Streptococcus sp. DD13]|nr:hypothetical protein STRDD13_00333 [Streptococcus sp. DD13]
MTKFVQFLPKLRPSSTHPPIPVQLHFILIRYGLFLKKTDISLF